jgi:archaellum component FlaC
MFTETVYTSWLDPRAGQIFDKVTNHQTISNEETLVLVLKVQNDQIRQLAESMAEGFNRMDRRFEQVDKRFEQMDKRFEQVDKRFEQVTSSFKWGLIAAMAFLSLLIAAMRFMS